MPSVYISDTPGPWLCDDDNVLCDGVVYTGTLYPYNQSLPTVDGSFPAPVDITYKTVVRSTTLGKTARNATTVARTGSGAGTVGKAAVRASTIAKVGSP